MYRIGFAAAIGLLYLGLTAAAACASTPKEIYRKSGPAVVFILASEGSATGSVGTGSIIREDGLVITNAHIFTRPDSRRLKSDIAVFLKPPRITGNHRTDLALRYRGKIVALDVPLDLALLQIQALDRPVSRIEFADAKAVTIGDQVYAIGHPEQGGLWSLTTGVISAFRADYGGVPGKNLFQTDASINRGNSGGPLLDSHGYMVGINSMIARKAADGLTITDVNYSIMADVALDWLEGLGYRFPVQDSVTVASDGPDAGSASAKPRPVAPKPEPQPVPVEPKPSREEASPVSPQAVEPEPVKPEPPPEPPQVTEKPPEPAPESQPKTEPEIETVPAEPEPQPKGKGGKILTQKKPYKMDALLKEMQAMEDLMEDMRGKIRDYKKRQ
jgi:serine protease Do